MTFKPMKAIYGEPKFPCIVQVKIDGVRALVKDGVVYSRALKPIPNRHIQKLFGHLHGLDGELLLSDDCRARCFNETTSAVMTKDGEPDVYFHVYDDWRREHPYSAWVENFMWYEKYNTGEGRQLSDKVLLHPYLPAPSQHYFDCYKKEATRLGLEGLIVRNPDAPYKWGSATKKDWQLLKFKQKDDAEFKVVGFEELMINNNEAVINELGRQTRSTKKQNLVPSGTLGALILEYNGGTVNVGTGFTSTQRKEFWEQKEYIIGKWAKVEYEGIAKDKPRFPSFKGFRDKRDMV